MRAYVFQASSERYAILYPVDQHPNHRRGRRCLQPVSLQISPVLSPVLSHLTSPACSPLVNPVANRQVNLPVNRQGNRRDSQVVNPVVSLQASPVLSLLEGRVTSPVLFLLVSPLPSRRLFRLLFPRQVRVESRAVSHLACLQLHHQGAPPLNRQASRLRPPRSWAPSL